jgi:uncharacterized protein YpmS
MKIYNYIIAFICTVTIALSAAEARETTQTRNYITEEINGLKTKIERLNGICENQSGSIVIDAKELNELVESYIQLKEENEAQQDYIEGFSQFMEQKYDFKGHQRRYMETH